MCIMLHILPQLLVTKSHSLASECLVIEITNTKLLYGSSPVSLIPAYTNCLSYALLGAHILKQLIFKLRQKLWLSD